MVRPESVTLHMTTLEASGVKWLIHVDHVIESDANDNLFLKLTIEHSIDDEEIRMRRLKVLIFAPDLEDDTSFRRIIDQIRYWVETTQGDGSLDLVLGT